MHGVSQPLTSQKNHLASGVGILIKDQFEIDHILYISAGMAVQKIDMFFVCNSGLIEIEVSWNLSVGVIGYFLLQ